MCIYSVLVLQSKAITRAEDTWYTPIGLPVGTRYTSYEVVPGTIPWYPWYYVVPPDTWYGTRYLLVDYRYQVPGTVSLIDVVLEVVVILLIK